MVWVRKPKFWIKTCLPSMRDNSDLLVFKILPSQNELLEELEQQPMLATLHVCSHKVVESMGLKMGYSPTWGFFFPCWDPQLPYIDVQLNGVSFCFLGSSSSHVFNHFSPLKRMVGFQVPSIYVT